MRIFSTCLIFDINSLTIYSYTTAIISLKIFPCFWSGKAFRRISEHYLNDF
jgi:hypothetical protein